MRRPADRIHAFFVRDVSGEWLLRTDTNRRRLAKKRTSMIHWQVTKIRVFIAHKDGVK